MPPCDQLRLNGLFMHEFSLAQGLYDQLLDLLDEHGADKIIMAEVGVGRDSGIVVDSFTFGFDVLARSSEKTRDIKLVTVEDSGSDLMLLRVELA